MISTLRKKYGGVIVVVIIFQLLALGGVYTWGINIIAREINRVISISKQPETPLGYNIEEAKKIDFKGSISPTKQQIINEQIRCPIRRSILLFLTLQI